jgi:hypothetical protein
MLPASPDNEGRQFAEYRSAKHLYLRSVSKLSLERVRVGDDFDKLMKLVDQARADFETARDALRKFRNSK